MNDRFRFRVWDKDNKRMLYKIENVYDGYGVEDEKGNEVVDCSADCFSSFFPYDDNDKNEEFIVEQCTGLRDKNGRLIYEGDLVKVSGDVMTIPIFYEESKAFINWDEDGFFLHFESGEIERLFQECWEYEVVGNIHENKELLEEKNDSKN